MLLRSCDGDVRVLQMAAKQLSAVSAVLGRVGPAQPNIIRLPTSAGKRAALSTLII